MSEQTRTASAASQTDTPLVPLLAVALAAAITAFALIRVSAGSASAWLGIFLGVGVALGGGLVLGRWWPGRAAHGTAATDAAPQPDGPLEPAPVTKRSDAVSALVDEEHFVGEAPPSSASDAADESSPAPENEAAEAAGDDERSADGPDTDELFENPADVQSDGGSETPGREAPPVQTLQQGHQVITPETLINDDHPTVAMQIPAAYPVAIDDKPQAEALAAKDEVIRSLESIVKENQDRWADFEAEREQFETRIRNLEAELRVATDLIEHGSDTPEEDLVAPQVLKQL